MFFFSEGGEIRVFVEPNEKNMIEKILKTYIKTVQ